MAIYASTWDYISATSTGGANSELIVSLFAVSLGTDPVLVVTF